MGKKVFEGRTALWLLCLMAIIAFPGYRAVQGYITSRMNGQLRSETESILQDLQAAILQKNVLLKKAAQEAGKYWEAGDTSSCGLLLSHYIVSYDTATGLGLSFAAGASAEGKALGVYAFRDEDRPVIYEEFPNGIDGAVSFDTKGSPPVLWLPFRHHPLTGAPTVTAAWPIRKADRNPVGIAIVDLDIFELQRLVTARGLPPSLRVDVLDGAGTVLATSCLAALMRPMAQNAPPDLTRAIEVVLKERAGEIVYAEGTEMIRLVFGTLPATGWKVCIRSRVREDFHNLRWFWENDVRIYSCCGFHTFRRTAAAAERKESDSTSVRRENKMSPSGKRRRFAPELTR